MKIETVKVAGMHCASCAYNIKKVIGTMPGVKMCDINIATEKGIISYDEQKISIDQMNQEIGKLGYSLHSQEEKSNKHTNHTISDDHDHAAMDLLRSKEDKLQEIAELKKNTHFVFPVALYIFLWMTWDVISHYTNVLPMFPISMDVMNKILFILATPILFWIGKPYIVGALRFFKYRVANMDTLVGIGTLVAYVYSTMLLLFPEIKAALNAPEGLYYDVTIVVIGFITYGKYLESTSKLKTGEALEKLLHLQAKSATIIRDGKEIEIPIDDVKIGDVMIVKPGQKIPLDGVILEGSSSVDEAMITGESIPVDKKTGDTVIGATINKQGSLNVQATKIGTDTMLSQIVNMVENAQGSRAPIQRVADQIAAIFVPVVLVFSVVVLLAWVLIGSQFMPLTQAFSLGLLAFVGILVIACPCAMGLATPTAIIVGVGKAAQHGILIKDAESLEKFHTVNYVVMDKTGTITKGKPEVTAIIPTGKNSSEKEVLQYLASLEKLSEHPLAHAIVSKAQDLSIELLPVKDFAVLEGKGLQGTIQNREYIAGNTAFMESINLNVDNNIIETFSQQGKTPVIFATQEEIIGYVALADTIKDDALETVTQLHRLGIHIAMLTGDHKNTAEYIAKQVGIDTVIAEVLPQHKAEEIQKLQKAGYIVAMVGDGINDAPALATADVGVAMGTGTDIAIESAAVTLLCGHISKLPLAINVSRATMNTVKQNLFWAFFYNIIGIPAAAGLLYPLFGIILNPAIAGAAMAFSSVSVVANSLRLKTKKL